ncbi:hypothetical protein [Candidatus Palauibacter sp.]|uniref:hypothetical protein n=1 Tax=Candidatus Palauibacter sp. TaxID=3101350 RepID=UPI003C6FA301
MEGDNDREAEVLAEARIAAIRCLCRVRAAHPAATKTSESKALAEAQESIIKALGCICTADLINTKARDAEKACGRLRTTCEERLEEKCNACSGALLTKLMV